MTNCRTCKRPTETGCLSCARANSAMRRASKATTTSAIVDDLMDAWAALQESRLNGGWTTNAVKKFFRVANRKYVTLALKEHYIENC